MNRKIIAIASMTAGLSALAAFNELASAWATKPIGPLPAETVYFSDMKLDSPAGVETLYGRLNNAARYVCDRSIANSTWSDSRSLWQQCYKQALADAVAKVNNERLTGLYEESQSKRAA
jgi:UrcA family protein